jgi:hypothetical protein
MSFGRPNRGDLVTYTDRYGHTGEYYFQPNGTSCYLYVNKEDVGFTERKAYAPSPNSVEKVKRVGVREQPSVQTSPYVPPKQSRFELSPQPFFEPGLQQIVQNDELILLQKQLNVALKELEQIKLQLSIECDVSGKLKVKINEGQKEVEILKSSLLNEQKQVERLEHSFSNEQKEVSHLRACLAEEREESKELRAKLLNERSETEHLKLQLSEVKKEIQELQAINKQKDEIEAVQIQVRLMDEREEIKLLKESLLKEQDEMEELKTTSWLCLFMLRRGFCRFW